MMSSYSRSIYFISIATLQNLAPMNYKAEEAENRITNNIFKKKKI